MNIPKVAIFDMDGLIFNTERQFFKFESMVHKKYGYPSRIEDFTQTLSVHLQGRRCGMRARCVP